MGMDCNKCVWARPFGGENDNRCASWACDFIDYKEAVKAYREKQKGAEHGDNTRPHDQRGAQ